MTEKPARRIRKRYVLLAALAGLLLYSITWTNTPYGKLSWPAAFTLRTLTFNIPITHGERHPQKITMPINILFALSPALPSEDVAQTRDIKIPSGNVQIPARVYWPEGYDKAKGPAPVVVYYHGGGFVTGSVDLFDQLNRSIANVGKAIVVSVDYRLAPDYPWPAGPDDAYAAAAWVSQNAASLGADPAKLFVGGDSAGGNLAAVVSLRARDENGPKIAGQILYYPAVDLTATRYPSQDKFENGYVLSSEAGAGFQKAYMGHLNQEQRANPYVSPIKAQSLAGLPPALILNGGFDPLSDSNSAYAKRLQQAGVPVKHVVYSDIIHGFMGVPFFSQRREGLDVTGKWMTEILSLPPAAVAAAPAAAAR